MMKNFSEIKKNFGFGFMRLPIRDGQVNIEEVNDMVDRFLKAGFNYFDTAHGYLNTESEKAIKTCLTDRYPRCKYVLTNKLTGSYFEKQEDIRPFLFKQLEACGVDYFDFYLMHAQSENSYPKFKACKAYETAFDFKKEGLVHHVGLSFHGTPQLLDEILTTYPELEVVQIQLNYLDWENPYVQARECYEVCKKHHKPVIVMEPVKGGTLVNLPNEAQKVFTDLKDGSNASYAIRFAASFDNVFMVLSGMSTLNQMEDNVSFMQDFVPLTSREREAVGKVKKILESQQVIPCTKCHYCVEENHCPQDIKIPEIFEAYNSWKAFNDFAARSHYASQLTKSARAKDCIQCGQCEAICPQHLPIREFLATISKDWDSK